MKRISAFLISEAKRKIPLIAKILGINLLNKDSTLKKLRKFAIFFLQGELIKISPVNTFGGVIEEFKLEEIVESSSVAVYRINSQRNIRILSYGGLKFENDVLDLDFGSSEFIRTIVKRDKRKNIHTSSCIVLWSHNWGGGYYDFLIFIYAKLLRIKSKIGESEFNKSLIIYPVFGKDFEKELFAYAGVMKEQIIDSRKFNIIADTYYLANNLSWFYPNSFDVKSLSSSVQTLSFDTYPKHERIYISRSGRRKLTNEKEVIQVLKEFGFTVISDTSRSVQEQMAIYRKAKVIIGPHGASFANILWCLPGTKLIELFPHNYYPPYFRYLAEVLKLDYHAIVENNVSATHYSNLDNDINIDPTTIKFALKEILFTKS